MEKKSEAHTPNTTLTTPPETHTNRESVPKRRQSTGCFSFKKRKESSEKPKNKKKMTEMLSEAFSRLLVAVSNQTL